MTRDENTTNSVQSLPKIKFENYRSLPVEHIKTNLSKGNVQQVKVETDNNPINAFSNFDYENEMIQLVFSSENFSFTPKSSALIYKNKIESQNVRKIAFKSQESAAGSVMKPISCGQSLRASFKFDNMNIDFFGSDDDRSFIVEFNYTISKYSDDYQFTSIYTVTLPILDLNRLDYVTPEILHPSSEVDTICKQEFLMTRENTGEEKTLCSTLELFKSFDLDVRYQNCGYLKMLRLYLDIENSFEQALIDKCAFSDAKLVSLGDKKFEIETPWPITNQAERLRLTPMSLLIEENNNVPDISEDEIIARIVKFLPKSVIIHIGNTEKLSMHQILSNGKYRVELVPNFFTSAMAFMAMKRIEENNFEEFLLNFQVSSLHSHTKSHLDEVTEFEWCNENVGASESQRMAIQQIVNLKNYPAPYIVFGPPGTGKTSTLVEAVAQIVKNHPKSRVLVTANSNSACDEIGERLLKYVGHNKIYRYYSPSFARKLDRVHPKLQPCSNLRYKYHLQPSVQEIISYNVIICTLVNSGRMKQLPADHFDFIFVDECASSAEAFVSIPLSLAMDKDLPFKTSIVLLGDPKQLGQIMKTHHCERFKFNVSMMERVMAMENYKFDETSGYNPNYITQLTDNFRSHEAILDFSNKNFYNSILKAKQVKQIADFALGWKHLPNPRIPLIFQASWTPSRLDGTSHYNEGDIAFVKKYVNFMIKEGINEKKISVGDIGVISPYAIQREKLKLALPFGIEIGTVEYFQGREKLIIIMSCVRSKTRTVGFLNNQKRLNVALTRAKGLLIVIGNPETLGKNKLWRRFMTSCKLVNAIAGRVPNWMYQKGLKELQVEEEDSDAILRLEEFMDGLVIED